MKIASASSSDVATVATTAKVAIVTGGSRGIGRAVAVALARAGFSVAVSVLTALLFCLGPAFQATSRSGRRWRGRSGLVVAQVALCTFLLTAAGLGHRHEVKLRSR